MGLSAIIITKNEEHNIGDCLSSLVWADEIVLVDAESRDATVSVARQFTGNIFVLPWRGFAGMKQYALEQTTQAWVLWIDADERVTPELAAEIRAVIGSDDACNGYEVPRLASFIGKEIRHCGWYPGYVVRLFRKREGSFTSAHVHEGLAVRGRIGRLQSHLLHYTDRTLFHYLHKFNRYTTLAAQDLRAAGRRCSIYDLTLRPFVTVLRMYIVRRGYLDGVHGLVLSMLSAAYVFTKYAKLRQLNQSEDG